VLLRMVNQTDTETSVFCYLQVLLSPQCFWPKMAQFLFIFIFPSIHYSYYVLPFA